MSENINKTTEEKSPEFQKGFEEGFHKGIVQGYIKGHTDATEEFEAKQQKNFLVKLVETITDILKGAIFTNTPMALILNAIKSLIKAIPTLSLTYTKREEAQVIPAN